jgi:hypothetical protein
MHFECTQAFKQAMAGILCAFYPLFATGLSEILTHIFADFALVTHIFAEMANLCDK